MGLDRGLYRDETGPGHSNQDASIREYKSKRRGVGGGNGQDGGCVKRYVEHQLEACVVCGGGGAPWRGGEVRKVRVRARGSGWK